MHVSPERSHVLIAIARFAVILPGETEATKAYRHTWMTESRDTALIELADWIANELPKIEQEEGWKMSLLEWTVEDRPDIGY